MEITVDAWAKRAGRHQRTIAIGSTDGGAPR